MGWFEGISTLTPTTETLVKDDSLKLSPHQDLNEPELNEVD